MKKKSAFFSIALIMALLSNLIFVVPAFAAASDKDITAFSLQLAATPLGGPTPTPSYVGVINESALPNPTISVTVPAGTNLTATNFYATFTTTGSSVKIGLTVQNSGTLPTNKFISPKTYTVTSVDGLTTKNYVVTVTVAPDPTAKDITVFSFVSPAATGSIVGTNITFNLPYGTAITALVPTITHTGASVSPNSGVAQDFTSPVIYTVTATDLSIKVYTVTVNVDPGTSKAITSFSVPGQIGSSVINEGAGTIGVTVSFGSDVTALTPTIVHTGASVSPNSGVAQNFTSPINYTVTALNTSTKAYTVTVTIAAPATTKAITGFSVPGQIGLTVINESAHTVLVTVPAAMDRSALTPTIIHSGASISPNSGAAQSFTVNPVTYTVTAQDGSTQAYSVTIAPSSAKNITAFSFVSLSAVGVINEASLPNPTIAVTVPFGTDRNGLVPTITISTNASVSPNNGVAQDYTNPINYTVTAADLSTKIYTVTVTVAPSPAKDITAFSFTSPSAVGVINGTNIAVTVPEATDVTVLVPTITHTGASISPNSGVAQNFTSPKVYTVTAADGTTKNYVVTVTKIVLSSSRNITSFSFASPSATGSINDASIPASISITVPYLTNVTALVPTIVHTGASISPSSGVAQNFTNPVTYTVTAADSSTKDYVVTVLIAQDSTPPTVNSITRVSSNPTNLTSVDYTITFSEDVTGVDVVGPVFNNFTLTASSGVINPSISAVNGSGTTYIVSVNTGNGNGTIRLNLVDDNSIVDAANNPLGGAVAGDGDFFTGEAYSIWKGLPPVVFGDQLFRTSNPPETITIFNSQLTGLNIGAITGSSSVGTTWNTLQDFFIENDTCSGVMVVVGGSCTFKVRFLPWSLGAKTGTITVPSDAPGQPYSVTLSGNSIAGTQLLSNRSFEAYSAVTNLPDLWIVSPGIKTGIDMVDSSWSFNGLKSFKFIGDGDLKILSQTINKAGGAGDDFSFSVMTRGVNIPSDANRWLMQIMFFDGSTVVENRNIVLTTGTFDNTRLTRMYTANTNYTSILFRVHYGKSSGTAWIDLASLQWAP